MTTVVTNKSAPALGYIAALGAAVAYGISALITRKIVSDFSSPIVGSAFSLMFGTIVVAAIFHRHLIDDALQAPKRAWLFVALAGCGAAWGVTFLFLALSQAPVVLVAPLSGTSPLVTIVLTHLFLQRLETVTWRIVIGGVMVVGGVALIALRTA